jgi:hypothetical protein
VIHPPRGQEPGGLATARAGSSALALSAGLSHPRLRARRGHGRRGRTWLRLGGAGHPAQAMGEVRPRTTTSLVGRRAHLRDLAGGRRHPGAGHRRADGARGHQPRRPAARQCHGRPLPAHHPGDGRPRRRGGRAAAQACAGGRRAGPRDRPEPLNAEDVLAATGRAFWQISGKRCRERRRWRCVPGGAEGI